MKIKFRAGLIAFGILCFTAMKVSAGDSASGNIYDFISKTAASDAPKGPFSSWSEDEKRQNMQKIISPCTMVCIMAFGDAPSGDSKELLQEEANTCSMACMYKSLPVDYPTREVWKENALKHYQITKSLGSKYPAPTFPE